MSFSCNNEWGTNCFITLSERMVIVHPKSDDCYSVDLTTEEEAGKTADSFLAHINCWTIPTWALLVLSQSMFHPLMEMPKSKALWFIIHFWLCLTCKYSTSRSLQDISERNPLISFLLWMKNQVIKRLHPHGRWCTKKIGRKICFGYWRRDRWHFWYCACTSHIHHHRRKSRNGYTVMMEAWCSQMW